MSDTMWFDKQPGQVAIQGSEEFGDPTTILISEGIPDWVRTPPELGSEKTKVLGAFWRDLLNVAGICRAHG